MVTLANINSPTQIVVSGEEDGVAKLMELAEEAGASRVVKLQVAAAFHSELMKPVQEQMAGAVRDVAWSNPRVPVASNSRGAIVDDAESLQAALVEQIASPVRWVECVQALVGAGVETPSKQARARARRPRPPDPSRRERLRPTRPHGWTSTAEES
jgi:[acyl-carrier-protein] S-malonyltransferase